MTPRSGVKTTLEMRCTFRGSRSQSGAPFFLLNPTSPKSVKDVLRLNTEAYGTKARLDFGGAGSLRLLVWRFFAGPVNPIDLNVEVLRASSWMREG